MFYITSYVTANDDRRFSAYSNFRIVLNYLLKLKLSAFYFWNIFDKIWPPSLRRRPYFVLWHFTNTFSTPPPTQFSTGWNYSKPIHNDEPNCHVHVPRCFYCSLSISNYVASYSQCFPSGARLNDSISCLTCLFQLTEKTRHVCSFIDWVICLNQKPKLILLLQKVDLPLKSDF